MTTATIENFNPQQCKLIAKICRLMEKVYKEGKGRTIPKRFGRLSPKNVMSGLINPPHFFTSESIMSLCCSRFVFSETCDSDLTFLTGGESDGEDCVPEWERVENLEADEPFRTSTP